MAIPILRTIYTVLRHQGRWAVEADGAYFGHAIYKDEAKAAASRMARQTMDSGGKCQIRVTGENGFFFAGADR